MELDEESLETTRIYSDCFNTYQQADFNSKGYILYKVNYSTYFGQGTFSYQHHRRCLEWNH